MAVPQENEVTYFARTNFRGQDRIFGIKTKDRRQHMYVVGQTGTGKSVFLKNLAIQDVQNGKGLAVVDPHGETVDGILEAIPPHRVNDVIYFNPADADWPIGFNVLEVVDPKYRHVVVSDLMGIFTKIWANVWSARMEYIMQNCILALIETPGTTLLGIPRLLVDREYRAKILANVKDPVVRSFWTQEYENYTDRLRSEAIVPIQNKVGQFLNTSMVRNIVGQPKSTFNIQEAMNEGKIILVNVSKGKIGEDNSALLGAMIITKLQLGAMERVRIPEGERKDFYLYVDEFQNFATDSFASILSEARKYRLNLIIAHQYIGQLVTDVSTKVRDAVFGNTGTLVTFRVGATDAEYMEAEYTPEFLPEDLVNLPNYHIYLKLMVDGVRSRPFSATTLPPIPVHVPSDTVDKVVQVSRERYAMPREKVEERIMRWSGMLPSDGNEEEDVSGLSGAGMSIGAGGVREEYEAMCASCAKKIKVPFKPDPRRPVYCPSCLKRVKEGESLPIMASRGPSQKSDEPRRRIGTDDSLASLGIEFEKTLPQKHADEGRPTKLSETPARSHMTPPISVPRNQGRPASPSFKRGEPVFGMDSARMSPAADFEAVCARCGKKTEVRFQPDSKRPVYCKLCFPIVQSERMRQSGSDHNWGIREKSSRPASGDPLRLASSEARARPGGRLPYPPHSPAPPRQALTMQQLKTFAVHKPISLKNALSQGGTTFSGKKLKKKEIDITALREALGDSLVLQDVPDVPEPEMGAAMHMAQGQHTGKGMPLVPGQKVSL